VFAQDCGEGCVQEANNDVYYSCTAGGSCSSTSLALADQVANPAASFPTDNNGVIVQLASIPAAGETTGSGYLVFGIGTESNNGLQGANVLTTDSEGNFTTTFEGQTLTSSFIDSGSNATFFNDSAITQCPSSSGASTSISDFYCPSSTMTLTAAFELSNASTVNASFAVSNANDLSDTVTADPGLAGTNPTTASFDWGLPFFYGRRVVNAIEGATTSVGTGPYIAF